MMIAILYHRVVFLSYSVISDVFILSDRMQILLLITEVDLCMEPRRACLAQTPTDHVACYLLLILGEDFCHRETEDSVIHVR